MKLIDIFLISISLAMDSFAVSVSKGLQLKRIKFSQIITVGLYFGLFQALMPIIGFFLGNSFKNFITAIDHWIAFVLLTTIGFNIIISTITNSPQNHNDKLDFKTMFILSLATSIDALAIGITFSFLDVNLPLAITSIGLTAFSLSALGIIIGHKFGQKTEKKAEIIGGLILMFIGLKILLEHLKII